MREWNKYNDEFEKKGTSLFSYTGDVLGVFQNTCDKYIYTDIQKHVKSVIREFGL